MESVDENLKMGEKIAKNVYRHAMRKKISMIYLIFSTYLPVVIFLKNFSSFVIYIVYVIVLLFIIESSRNIPSTVIKIDFEIRGKKIKPGLNFIFGRFFFPLFFMIFVPVIMEFVLFLIDKNLLWVLNIYIIFIIALWFLRTFKLIEGTHLTIWDAIAIMGFIAGLGLGLFVYQPFIYLFPVSWLTAGVGSLLNLKDGIQENE